MTNWCLWLSSPGIKSLNGMNFQSYLDYFNQILNSANPEGPYNQPDYLEYTRLNWSRLNRWLKHGVLSPRLQEFITGIEKPQSWIIITEPWCGDAAHTVPFMEMTAALNPLIAVSYELRDSPPHRITQYLTNGSKSIPILIVKNENGEDLFRWGPRPKDAQQLFLKLHAENAVFDEMKTALQKWYNKDKGEAFQEELLHLFLK